MTSLVYQNSDGDAVIEASEDTPYPVMDMSQRSLRTAVLPQVVVSITVPTRICPANPLRRSVKVTNITGTYPVWIDVDSIVSATKGDYLHSGLGSSNTYYGRGELWGLAVTAAQTVSVAEDIFDA